MATPTTLSKTPSTGLDAITEEMDEDGRHLSRMLGVVILLAVVEVVIFGAITWFWFTR